jgi:serine/threonine protein kinase
MAISSVVTLVLIDARDNAKVLDVCSGGVTHGYFWPSEADNESLSPSFDIYSLGVIFWQLSSGGTPQFRTPPIVSELDCSPGYAELVRKCVTTSSNDRPLISQIIAEISSIEETFR